MVAGPGGIQDEGEDLRVSHLFRDISSSCTRSLSTIGGQLSVTYCWIQIIESQISLKQNFLKSK